MIWYVLTRRLVEEAPHSAFTSFALNSGPLERGIERTLFNLQQVIGPLLDVLDQRVSVGRLSAGANWRIIISSAPGNRSRGLVFGIGMLT